MKSSSNDWEQERKTLLADIACLRTVNSDLEKKNKKLKEKLKELGTDYENLTETMKQKLAGKVKCTSPDVAKKEDTPHQQLNSSSDINSPILTTTASEAVAVANIDDPQKMIGLKIHKLQGQKYGWCLGTINSWRMEMNEDNEDREEPLFNIFYEAENEEEELYMAELLPWLVGPAPITPKVVPSKPIPSPVQPPVRSATAPVVAPAASSFKPHKHRGKDNIPLRAKRPERTATAAPADADSRKAKLREMPASQKDYAMANPLPLPGLDHKRRKMNHGAHPEHAVACDSSPEISKEQQMKDYTRRFEEVVERHQAQKSYVSDFGKGFVPPKAVKAVKRIETVRNKEERAAMPGYACSECAAFYEAMVQQGIFSKENLPDMLKCCSRHKSKYTPPDTPEGVWGLSVNTPNEWKEQDKKRKEL